MRRFVADENFPGLAVRRLRAAGCDVIWICEDQPSASDAAVLKIAQAERRVLLTFDKDFGELAFHSRLPSDWGIILFRLPMSPAADAIDRIVAVILQRPSWSGSFCVIEPDRIRERTI